VETATTKHRSGWISGPWALLVAASRCSRPTWTLPTSRSLGCSGT
jgi:hypothetical protein